MKKKCFLLLILLIIPFCARAELSTNLMIRTVMLQNNKKLVASKTYTDAAGNVVVPSDKGYATIRYTYGTGNRIIKEELLDENGELVDGADGYAYKASRFSIGQLTEVAYFNKAGEPVNGPEGYAKQVSKYRSRKHQNTWCYDTDGNPVGTHRITEYLNNALVTSDTWYDTEGNLAPGPYGYARVEYEYFGRIKTRIAYISADGTPYYYKNAGYATMVSVYEIGKIRSTHYYGAGGKPVAGPDGYAYILYTYSGKNKTEMYYNADGSLYYDDRGVCGVCGKEGRHKDEYYLVGEGIRGNCIDGYSRTTIKYNIGGEIDTQKYYDINDQLMIVESLGYAHVKNYYQGGTRIAQSYYFGTDGKPIRCNEGYAVARYNYDKDKLLTDKTFYDTDRKTVVNCTDGYAQVLYTNTDGSKDSEKFYTADGEPCAVKGLYDEIRYSWSGKNQTETSYWKNGEAADGEDGYHRILTEYNGADKESKKTYLDRNDRLMLCEDGYAILETEYNSRGGVMCKKYYGTDGRLINTPGQSYAFTRTVLFRDAQENIQTDEDEENGEAEASGNLKNAEIQADDMDTGEGSILEYHGTDGRLMNTSAGYAYIVRENNEKGYVECESYFSADGVPVVLAQGYAQVRKAYNDEGQVSEESYFDPFGKPVARLLGYHSIKKSYPDPESNRFSVLDNEGPVTITEESYYDLDGKITVCTEGYDKVWKVTNDQYQIILMKFYLDGEAADIPQGYTIVTREYGEDGLVAAENYYDKDEKPVLCAAGYHRVRRTWEGPGRISSEAWFDTAGQPTGLNGDTYVRREREYDENGNVSVERYYDAEGKPIACTGGYDELRREYNDEGQVVRMACYLGGEITAMQNGSFVVRRAYDIEGLIAEESYYNAEDEPMLCEAGYHKVLRTWADPQHASSEAWFGTDGQPTGLNGDTYVRREREYDEDGNVSVERYYGADGKPAACAGGYDELRREYNGEGQMVRMACYLGGEITAMQNGSFVLRRTYDDEGLVAEESYFDAEDEPMLCEAGYHKILRTWADPQHASSEAWFGTDGQPTALNDDTYVMREREYDGDGNVSVERYFDAGRNPVACKDGYDELRREYNENHQMIRMACCLNGEIIATPNGSYITRRAYDEEGLIAEESYFDAEDKPMLCAGGYHRILRTWADPQHASSEAWFDTDGQPMGLNGDTYVRREREYDEDDNVSVERYYDADGKPVACSGGYDELRREYNENHQMIRMACYLGGEITATPNGSFITRRAYDEEGMIAEESYYSAEDEPMLCAGGYHRIRRTWADPQHASSEAWFDTDGKPTGLNGDTYVRREREYDEDGNVSIERYYGADGDSIACSGGYDELRREYNENHQMIRMACYLEGKIIATPNGSYITRRAYDEEGLIAEESYFDAEDEPMLCAGGYHRILRTWADPQHASSEAWFDTDGQPMTLNGDTYVRREREYDGYGNVSVERYYGADGNPIACREGFDELRREYNGEAQMIRMACCLDGKIIAMPNGSYITRRAYDEAGLVADESYFDAEDEPMLCAAGYHRILRTWADPQHASSEAWFDTDGQPMGLNGDTYVRRERDYDGDGNVSVERYYSADGNPIACLEGFDELRREYNEKHQMIRMVCYLEGKIIAMPNGSYITRRAYDENGLVAEESYFDAEDEPTLCTAGYHRILRTWADPQHVSGEAWFDTDGQPTGLNGDTYVRREREYDEDGNVSVERYYGADGDPIACSGGYDEFRREYNENHQMIRMACYLEGKIIAMPNGSYITRRAYDENGLVAEESYFSAEDEPIACTSGYHRILRTWADPQHASSEAWFDTDGRPMGLNGDTYVRREREYDENGNVSVERYYGPDGSPAACREGFDELRREYNDLHQMIRMACCLGGEIIAMPNGSFITCRAYDDAGLVAEESYFDADDKPMQCAAGYHKIVRTWADPQHASSEAWFDTDGQPMGLNGDTYVRREREYDEDGNVGVERYYGPDGNPVACREGFDELRREYNDLHQMIRMACYLDEEIIAMPNGSYITRRAYDGNGLVAEESYFSAEDEPIACTAGYHRIVRTWADPQHVSAEAWFDADGQPTGLNGETYVMRERDYDADGNVAAERYYDADGNPAACRNGYDEIRWTDGEAAYFLNGEEYVPPAGEGAA